VQGESSVFRKILKLFGHFSKALDWVCGFSKRLGFKSSFGLLSVRWVFFFWVAGRVIKRYKAALKGFRFRDGSSQLVLMPNAKRVIGHDSVFEPIAFAIDSSLEPSLDTGADAGRVSGPGVSPSLGVDQISLVSPEAMSLAAMDAYMVTGTGLRWVLVRLWDGSWSLFSVCSLWWRFQVPSLVSFSCTLNRILSRRFMGGILLLWSLCVPLLSLPLLSLLCKSVVQLFLSMNRVLRSFLWCPASLLLGQIVTLRHCVSRNVNLRLLRFYLVRI
jgi:hypothetical protein